MHFQTQSAPCQCFFRADVSNRLESKGSDGKVCLSKTVGKQPQPTINKKTRRGKGKYSKNEQSEKLFSIWGNNANGLKAKMDSLKANIDYYKQPSCITIQESKLRNCNTIKIEGYKVFERNRIGLGGGLITAVLN